MSSNRIAEEEYSFKDMEPQQVKNTKKPGSDIRGQRQRKHPEEAQEDSEKVHSDPRPLKQGDKVQ